VDRSSPEACLARLWAGCQRDTGKAARRPAEAGEVVPLGDFDVLSVVDHRMRWYSEDVPAFSKALEGVCQRYRHVLFVGASMGGFGALLHGGRLAGAVLAFSPQADLVEATLRPPAPDVAALTGLADRLFESIETASGRGALVEVHCAADEHLLHALSMPLRHVDLTVHPLLPRKPFARLLDRARLLLPIISDTVGRLLQETGPEAVAARAERAARAGSAEHRVAVACWSADGSLERHRAEPFELLRLFFGPGAPHMPRPGDWFCPRCNCRNMSSHFFCWTCGIDPEAQVAAAGTACIPGGQNYPQPGDWGCGYCGQALCGYHDRCHRCGTAKWSHEKTVVAG